MRTTQAKDFLCERVDTYIRERIILADQVIRTAAMEKIRDGDTVLVYARSVATSYHLRTVGLTQLFVLDHLS